MSARMDEGGEVGVRRALHLRGGSSGRARCAGCCCARACTVCLAPAAHFPVRRGASGVGCVFRLCKGCARRDKVQEQLRWHGLAVDSIGEHGKPLRSRGSSARRSSAPPTASPGERAACTHD